MVSAQGEGWLSGWDYRQRITITGSAGAGTNYPICLDVSYDAEMQTDFDDIRVTDRGGVTLLDYWLETKTDSVSAVVWVEVTDNLNDTQIIYMYFGNDAVSTLSDGHAVFEFFDDFETDNLTDYWETIDDDWSTQGVTVKYGSFAAYGNSGTGGAGRALSVDTVIDETEFFDGSNDFMVHAHMRLQSVAGEAYQMYSADSDAAIYVSLINTDDWVTYTTATGIKPYSSNCFSTSTWYRLEIGVSFSDDTLYPFLDRVAKTNQILADKNNNSVDLVDTAIVYADPSANRDVWVDDYYIRKWVASEPIATFGVWSTINTAEFIFPMGWHPIAQFGYDAFFIFLGLIMIPASTMYLVRGGRKDMSMDKVFYGLIVFAVGLGLLIGGIMP